MNPLNEYPAARKVAYLFQWLANLATGILSIVFLNDAHEGVPQWFTVTVLVLAFVWTYTGLTAQQNVPSLRDVAAGEVDPAEANRIMRDERGAIDVGTAIVIGLLVVLLLVLLGVFR